MARKRGYVPYKIQRALNGGRGGLLSHTEEVALGRRAQSGDGEARLRLAVCVAREYRGRGLPFEDLI
jgi:RNA polymerase primary sigma factor